MSEEIKTNVWTKKRKMIVIIAAVAVILLALAVGMGIYNSPGNRIARQMDLGYKYLENGQYEEAIVAFTRAIEIDPMNADTYLMLSDAYEGMGDYEKAIEVLQKGYELTKDERLQAKTDDINRILTSEERQTSDGAGTEGFDEEAVERSEAGAYKNMLFDGDTEKFIDSLIAACVNGQYDEAHDMVAGDMFKSVLDKYGYLPKPDRDAQYADPIRALHNEARVYMYRYISENYQNCLFAYLPQSGTGFAVEDTHADWGDTWGYVKGDVADYSFNGPFYQWSKTNMSGKASSYVYKYEGTLVDNCYDGKVIYNVDWDVDGKTGSNSEMYRLYENGGLTSLGDDTVNQGYIIYERTSEHNGWSSMSEEDFRKSEQGRIACMPTGQGTYPVPAPWEEVK